MNCTPESAAGNGEGGLIKQGNGSARQCNERNDATEGGK
jgi:hypothetical protein